jgi:hypothetical protein
VAELVRPSESDHRERAKVKRTHGAAAQVKFDTVLKVLLAHDLAALGQGLHSGGPSRGSNWRTPPDRRAHAAGARDIVGGCEFGA